ncbi:MAG: hypothetical protein LBQ54_11010 [Planctomycetaceae bacterium]|nr:hypothetical protein [Planctomycetaceae bacterium]
MTSEILRATLIDYYRSRLERQRRPLNGNNLTGMSQAYTPNICTSSSR